jgi:hypothetical protein
MDMMKRYMIGAALGALVASTGAIAAGNSEAGIDRYLNNPGRQQATEVGAQCGSGAGSGAFGFLGKDNNMGVKSDPTDPGANGQQTGLNNSSVCGNRQGNLP